VRNVQIALLCLAIVAFVTALFFAGSVAGDVLWRVGIAVLLVDVVAIMLWPRAPVGRSDREHG
jgi:hypothetical protein